MILLKCGCCLQRKQRESVCLLPVSLFLWLGASQGLGRWPAWRQADNTGRVAVHPVFLLLGGYQVDP